MQYRTEELVIAMIVTATRKIASLGIFLSLAFLLFTFSFLVELPINILAEQLDEENTYF